MAPLRALLGTGLLTASAALVLLAAPGASAQQGVAQLPLTFTVDNVNRSAVACAADGTTYELGATLVGPTELLVQRRLPAAVLYVHGLGLTSYYWHYAPEPAHDHVVQMAHLGHVGLVYDRLGYGDNPTPDGLQSCYGSEADVAAQLVEKLKTGDYVVERGAPLSFERVAVASHSQGGLIVQPMAYSFDVADGLVVTSWADGGNRPQVALEAGTTAQDCLASGATGEPGPFYAYYPRDDSAFRAFYFSAAPEALATAATDLREPDACGQGGSLAQTLLADQARLGEVHLPVLLVYGEEDGYRDAASSGQGHAALFSGSPDVTLEVIPGTGNALTLEPTAPQFRRLLAGWLCDRDLAAPPACARPADSPQPPASPAQAAPPAGGAARASSAAALPATGLGPVALGAIVAVAAAGVLRRPERAR